MEQGKKFIKRDFIVKLAEIYNSNKEELLTIWLADQLLNIVKDESTALNAIQIAESEVKYHRSTNS